jgi:hypothetical protein
MYRCSAVVCSLFNASDFTTELHLEDNGCHGKYTALHRSAPIARRRERRLFATALLNHDYSGFPRPHCKSAADVGLIRWGSNWQPLLHLSAAAPAISHRREALPPSLQTPRQQSGAAGCRSSRSRLFRRRASANFAARGQARGKRRGLLPRRARCRVMSSPSPSPSRSVRPGERDVACAASSSHARTRTRTGRPAPPRVETFPLSKK